MGNQKYNKFITYMRREEMWRGDRDRNEEFLSIQ